MPFSYDDMPTKELIARAKQEGIEFTQNPGDHSLWHDSRGTAHPALIDALRQRRDEILQWKTDHPDS
jgi:hypothetical protein